MAKFTDQVSGEDLDDLIDPHAMKVLDLMAAAPPLTEVADIRTDFTAGARKLSGPPEPVRSVHDVQIPTPHGPAAARVYRPSDAPGLPVVVYFHGGGFIKGDLDSHEPALRRLANRAGAIVVALDYTRTPEAGYPVQPDQAYAATVWAAQHAADLGGDGSRLAVAGDSVGGLLAAVTAQRCRDRGGPHLAFQLLLYPVTDLTFESDSQARFAQGPVLYKEPHLEVLAHYIARDRDLREPDVSPLFAPDLSGLPPALVVTGQFDALRDDGESYARALAAAGVPVTATRYGGLIHDFLLFADVIDASGQLIEQAAGALRRAFAASAPDPDRTILEAVVAVDARVRRIEAELVAAERLRQHPPASGVLAGYAPAVQARHDAARGAFDQAANGV